MALTQENRDQLNTIIGKMKDNNEPEDSIMEMVGQFKTKYDVSVSPKEIIPAETSRKTMANIPPLTPMQELTTPTQTPEEQEQARKGGLELGKSALEFMWPGKEKAKSDILRGVRPALGIAGATTGSLAGPWGTAFGYAAGERVGKGIETLTGISEPETLPESVGHAAADVVLGRYLPLAIEKIPQIPGAIKRAVTQPWTKGGKVEEVFKTVGGKLAPYSAGESGVAGAEKLYSDIFKQGTQRYNIAESVTPKGTTGQANNLFSTIDDILTDVGSSDAERTLAQRFLKRIAPGTTKRTGMSAEQQLDLLERGMETGQESITMTPLKSSEMYDIRGQISRETTKPGRVGWRARQMLNSFHEDLTTMGEKSGSSEATKAYKDAISFWKNKVVPQREAVDMLKKPSPEEIPTKLLMEDVRTSETIKASMPSENFRGLKQGVLTHISERNEGNPIKIGKELRSLMATKKEVMQSIFDEEERGAINLAGDPTELGRFFEEHPKTKWLVKFIGYGAAYGTLGYGALRHLFGFRL